MVLADVICTVRGLLSSWVQALAPLQTQIAPLSRNWVRVAPPLTPAATSPTVCGLASMRVQPVIGAPS